MTKTLLILLGVLLHTTLWAQYTYFNSHLGPLGGVEAGSGTSTNLLVRNNQLISIVNYPNFGNVSMTFNVQNIEGDWVDQVVNQTNGQMQTNYANSFCLYNGGILGAGRFLAGPWPSIRWFDEALLLSWEKQVPLFYDENNEPVFHSEFISGSFHFVRPLSDGGFVVAGRITHNFGPDQHYSNLWLQRYDANHELVWNKEYPFYNDGIIPVGKRFLRVNDLFELPNGDLLLWGCWYHAWMPMVLRFDSQGNFLDHTSWGASGPIQTINDWLPWPVKIGEEEFLFAYMHGTIYESLTVEYRKPRIGHFDAVTMEVTLFDPIDREAKHHYLNDFVKAVDGGYVALGYGTIPDPENPDDNNFNASFAYLIKVNEQGEEIWARSYTPPVDHINPWVYDLEVTPDGGYAFVGNFRLVEDGVITNEKRQWVVKTDACGELVYNGCVAVVNPTSVQEHVTPELLVWPNPTNGILNIQLLEVNAAQIEVFDLRGQMVDHRTFSSTQKEFALDLSHVAPGLYGIRLLSSSGAVIKQSKLIKQ